jgi:polyferredoxin/tetratricopeptide (TPR) repeat protein
MAAKTKDTQATKAPKKDCTAPGQTTPGPKRSKMSRWRIGVLLLVHLLFAIHLAHWMETGESLSLVEPSEAMEFSKRSVINTGLIFFLITIGSTLLLGRFFCGWACHVVALQDASRWLLLKVGIRPRPLRSRVLVWMPVLAAFYMFFWPSVYRAWHALRGNAFDIETTTNLTTQDFWGTMPGVFVGVATLFTAGFLCVYFLGAKGFCTYGCPYGAIFGVLDKVSPGRIRVTDACEGCGHCTLTCTSNVAVAREVRDYGMVVDPGCMKCMDCISVCPKDALFFGFGKPALGAEPRRETTAVPAALTWPEEGVLLVTFLATFAAVHGIWALGSLYQVVPLLFSMGIAALFAFAALKMFQLVTRDDVTIVGKPLKKSGSWTMRGKFHALACLGLFALWGHSAWMQLESVFVREEFKSNLSALHVGWFQNQPTPSADQIESAEFVLLHGDRVSKYGFILDPEVARYAAWAAMFLGDEDRFLEDMQRAQERNPRVNIYSLELGYYFQKTYQDSLSTIEVNKSALDKGIAYFESAVRLDPDIGYAWDALVSAHQMRGTLNQALAMVNEGLDMRPRSAHLTAKYGWLLMMTHDEQRARGFFERTLVLDPAHRDARLILVQGYYSQSGRVDDCLRLLDEGLAFEPTFIPYTKTKVELLQSLGRESEAKLATDAAVEACEAKLAKFPKDVQLRMALIRNLYPFAGKQAKMLGCARDGITELPGEIQFHLAVIDLCMNLQGTEAAEIAARSALTQFPDDQRLIQFLGEVGISIDKIRTQTGG